DEPIVSTFCTVSHVTNDEVDDGFKAIITFGSGLTAQVMESCCSTRFHDKGKSSSPFLPPNKC
ncbi:MAG: hypothetical protein IIT63_00265, partial [Prevotella sp.]|nr:hypothetical protein [Prevotella sp.]